MLTRMFRAAFSYWITPDVSRPDETEFSRVLR